MNPNKIFPILCQDDFFDNPDEIREYALSLDYKSDENGHWPGVRTRPLHEINPKLATEVLVKVFSIDDAPIDVSESILALPNDTLIYAIGNQVGVGQEILQILSEKKSNG